MKKLLSCLKVLLLTIFSLLIILLALHEIEMHFAIKKNLNVEKPVKYPIGKSDLSIYTNGKIFYKQLFTDIQHAKQAVHIYFFSISNDAISHQFLDILKKKSDEGIPVYYGVDRLGGLLLSNKEKKELEAHGVHFTYFNEPTLSYYFSSINHRNHRRMTIIDGEIGYIGGFNIGKKYVSENKKLKHWEDVQLRLVGSGVEGLEDQFVIDWRRNTSQQISPMKITSKFGNSEHRFISYTKLGIQDEYVKLFNDAKKSITIYSPYFIPNNKVIWDALLDAPKRGIDVKILYSHKSDAILVEQAAVKYIRQAIKQGIQVYGYKPGIFHGKVIKVDDSILMIGTTNFDSRSFHLTDEINCYIYDQDFIKSVEPKFLNEFNQSFQITEAYLNNLSWKDRMKERIAKLVEYYL